MKKYAKLKYDCCLKLYPYLNGTAEILIFYMEDTLNDTPCHFIFVTKQH